MTTIKSWRLGLAGVMVGGVVAVTGMAVAQAPNQSLRPQPRPGADVAVDVKPAMIKPRARPAIEAQPVIGADRVTDAAAPMPVTLSETLVASQPTALAVNRSLRPVPRPKHLARKAAVSSAAPSNSDSRGRVCGVNDIKGQVISAIRGRISGCGVSEPVRITELSGVKLSQPSVMDCPTARALNSWVRNGVVPAVGRLGGGVSSLRVVAHYACRPRNNKPGAKISEHGRGRAIDIAGIRLKNGAEISVLKDWRDPMKGKILKRMHKAACGPFGTVLGPDGDRYHQDHFHFDTAAYRSGPYCR